MTVIDSKIIFNYYFQFVIILQLEMGKSMFCTAFVSKKTIFLDFNIKISTQPSLSWFDQNLREQAKFIYSFLGEKKLTKKQVDTLNSLNISNKSDELNQIKVYFHKTS